MNLNPFNNNKSDPMDEEYSRQEDLMESSDQQIQMDQMQRNLNYPSHMLPEDDFQYKKYRNEPEARAEFEGLIDKDVTFANLSKNDISFNSFKVETIKVCEDIFVKEQDVKFRDNTGKDVIIKDQLLFDEDFRPIVNYLKAGYKYDHVASRAVGDDRAARLDVTNYSNVNKQLTKRKENNNSKYGLGN